MATENKRMRQLNATESEWAAFNPVLLDGEIAFSQDVRKYKVGDGTTPWAGLDYWGGGAGFDEPPADNITYGRRPNLWSQTINYQDTHSGDLASIPPDRVKFVRLGTGATDAWDTYSPGDFLLDLADPTDGYRVQVGYSYSSSSNAGAVVHTRVFRDTWSEWVSNVVFNEADFTANLNSITTSQSRYSAQLVLGQTVGNAWPGAAAGSFVHHTNLDLDNALQFGIDKLTNAAWTRSLNDGTWDDWKTVRVFEDSIVNLDRVRWRNVWQVGGTYLENDMVRDGNWTMVANKTTTDRPSPQPSGPETPDLPLAPSFQTLEFTGYVAVAHEFTTTTAGAPVTAEVWVPEIGQNISYRLTVTNLATGTILQNIPIDPVQANVWFPIAIDTSIMPINNNFEVRLFSQNDASTQVTLADLNKGAPSQTPGTDPGVGNYGTDNQEIVLRVSKTDADANDISTLLASIVPGTTIDFQNKNVPSQFESFTVTDTATQPEFPDHWSFTGSMSGSGIDVGSETTATFTVPTPAPTKYVVLEDYWSTFEPSWANVSSDRDLGGIAAPQPANAYGIRIVFQPYIASEDWDIVAVTGGAGGGGGGGTPGEGASVTTGPAFPGTALLGDLHYLTVDPVGLYVYFDDGTTEQWVQTNGGGVQGDPGPAGPEGPQGPQGEKGDPGEEFAVSVGTTFPGTPKLGSLHYMTADPVGLYVYIDDGNSQQWVQTNGS